ncbi:glyoxylase-like metal-dependent hydrolase (beta-lactamase superfamily II) [Tahibacter aquaticus]|uniref:Glyoxylase-like metal-dependent hydrolase (Beta-lactamase superfamily II) n=1 Tax=Tahibacter aquaticus TaxID=520092 RepID=A0A4R6YQY1_9GAMM|nr:MBL fold metallo-hydrolase [Tahibacter aquaticus]TDR40417.1 glyoxylase-like metal-dependent hydrolase (beta-lactamase superfamily II) [Tahibacter aquaticus]
MPLQIQSYFHSATSTWSHLASNGDGTAAAIIDPVLDFDSVSGRICSESAQAILAAVHAHRLRVEWILETHAHADHLSGADWLKRQLQAEGMPARTGIGRGIVGVQAHWRQVFQLGDEFPADGSDFDQLIDDGDSLALGELVIEALATPGHTSDGMSYRIGDAVFVGDTVFSPAAGTGRCDFPGGDAVAQFRSIQRLYSLPAQTQLYLCHDYPPKDAEPREMVDLVEQRSGNAQVRRDTAEADYVALRHARDAGLPPPRLLYAALQVNIRAGKLPPPQANGVSFLKIPLS